MGAELGVGVAVISGVGVGAPGDVIGVGAGVGVLCGVRKFIVAFALFPDVSFEVMLARRCVSVGRLPTVI